MACLKCGKKTTDEQSFCPACLAVMEGYPVDPDIHVQLPNRSGAPKKPGRKRRQPSAEEQVVILRKRTRWLMALALVLILLLGGAVFFLVREWIAEDEIPVGQNFTAEQTFD